MKQIYTSIEQAVVSFFKEEFEIPLDEISFQQTKKEFEGDLTLVLFPYLRQTKTSPDILGQRLGDFLVVQAPEVTTYNVVKGFLNLSLSDAFYISQFKALKAIGNFGIQAVAENAPTVLIEYSSPNTNKPLHLGHIRNNLLGHAVANILSANGKRVIRAQIINDRGIHICKSMVAWKRYGQGETPQSQKIKGDQLVGHYYVKFDQVYKEEIKALMAKGQTEEQAKQQASILQEAQNLLRLWEAGDKETRALWKQMNQWVYDGFELTYKNLGVFFDRLYYESETYLLGKDIIEEGLAKNIFYKKEDGSVWIDLTDEGLDEKLLLRADGTAVYITQDLGTAHQRLTDFPSLSEMVYTVGNEQDYHFKVLFLVFKKLGYTWANALFHLSYGMVDLPSGKMKSREGNVVDADDLIEQMRSTAKDISEGVGKLEGLKEQEKKNLYHTVGLGALKYYILKVDPKKRILFDPKESVDFNGNTGPFIQYTHARIKTLLSKASYGQHSFSDKLVLDAKERAIIQQLLLFPEVVTQAGQQYSPALVANYVYDLVKVFNTFYQNINVLLAKDLQQ
ncbi:MAG: arginine--tRNA ligase, partial [Flavobacteriaceae bacterium]